jgi:hypothetical protein
MKKKKKYQKDARIWGENVGNIGKSIASEHIYDIAYLAYKRSA